MIDTEFTDVPRQSVIEYEGRHVGTAAPDSDTLMLRIPINRLKSS